MADQKGSGTVSRNGEDKLFPRRVRLRGPEQRVKRVAAPKHRMLDKLTGVFASRPSAGPHKLRECLPLIVFLRSRLVCALTGEEVKGICVQQFTKIEGEVRTHVPRCWCYGRDQHWQDQREVPSGL